MLRRLTPVYEISVREQQARFRPCGGCIDQIFSLHQLLGTRHVHRHLSIVIFIDLKGAFDSVDLTRLFHDFHPKGMSVKFVNLQWVIKFIRNDHRCSTRISHLPLPVQFCHGQANGECRCQIGEREKLCGLDYADGFVCLRNMRNVHWTGSWGL